MEKKQHEIYLVPTMLYHVGEGEKIFNTQEEVEDALDNKGWTRSPNQMTKAEELRNKIAFHKEQAKTLQNELDEIMIYKGDDTKYLCDICGKDCTNKLGLISHKRVHDKKEEE